MDFRADTLKANANAAGLSEDLGMSDNRKSALSNEV